MLSFDDHDFFSDQGHNTDSEEEKENKSTLGLSDLLQFSNQVAQGMSFLASKNVSISSSK